MGGGIRFPERPRVLSVEEVSLAAERILSVPVLEREARADDLQIGDPDTIAIVIRKLHERMEASPEAVRADAEFFYRFLGDPKRDVGLLDERDYFIGEFALIAGVVCRHLSRRAEAVLWFDRSQVNFLSVINELPHSTRLTYQRLAVRTEERQLEEVAELLPAVSRSFSNQGMRQHALKCRFLEGMVLMETGRHEEGVKLFLEVGQKAQSMGNVKLMAAAYVNLIQLYARLGAWSQALSAMSEAAPLLRESGNRICVARLQWGIGDMFRRQIEEAARVGAASREEKICSAIEAYRSAQKEFTDLGMCADVAALHLVVADLLLDAGRDAQALWEVQAALPVIEKYQLVSEGYAALVLLRGSLKNHRIDRDALRRLHGYFEELES